LTEIAAARNSVLLLGSFVLHWRAASVLDYMFTSFQGHFGKICTVRRPCRVCLTRVRVVYSSVQVARDNLASRCFLLKEC